jgi:hypothetical protein
VFSHVYFLCNCVVGAYTFNGISITNQQKNNAQI